MTPLKVRHIYGPVPSRRLGRSLGIDLNEALKHLEALATANRLQRVVKNREIFYTTSLAKAPS